MTKRNWTPALSALTVALLLLTMLAFSGCKEDPPPTPPPECQDDMDCPGGKACEGGKCIKKELPPPPECTSDADCSGNKVCIDEKCEYECQSDSACGAGKVCTDNRCTEPACEVETINFDFNEYYLTSEAQRVLRANADCLKKKKVARIVLEGHCDERGSVEYNLSLGQKRAQSVRDFLVDLGIESSSIKVISYGEERPIDPASNEDAWAKNRRAETVIE